MNATARLDPDIAHAVAFLAQLDADPDSFTFQAFSDQRDANSVRPLILHGSVDTNAERLIAANRSGAGIFVMVNAGDQRGRSRANVIRVRSHFVDLDKTGIDPILTALDAPPHIVVESSPSKFHAYWLTEDVTLEEFSDGQRALALRFGGDPSVCDLPRVMRLPGFYHLKNLEEPFLTRTITGSAA